MSKQTALPFARRPKLRDLETIYRRPAARKRVPRFPVIAPKAGDRTSSVSYAFLKRFFDVTLSLLALLVCGPLLLLVAGTLLVRAGRPILFSQERVGRHGAQFRLYKFRTLPNSASEHADREWSVDAPAGLARFLRRTGLDELPQLFNVLRGDMSLVGPRPERPYFVRRFQQERPSYSDRHRLQVGITGWAQVNGWRGDTSILRRLECDLYYLHHWSLALDLRILGATLVGLVRDVWISLRPDTSARYARIV